MSEGVGFNTRMGTPMTAVERTPPADYEPVPGAYDEMYDASGHPRGGLDQLDAALRGLGSEGLRDRGRVRDSHLTAQGITFTLSGRERPLPLDLTPRVIEADEWRTIDQGVR